MYLLPADDGDHHTLSLERQRGGTAQKLSYERLWTGSATKHNLATQRHNMHLWSHREREGEQYLAYRTA